MCICVVAATTPVGGAARAPIGALAMGIGAAPGAALGATAGFEAGIADAAASRVPEFVWPTEAEAAASTEADVLTLLEKIDKQGAHHAQHDARASRPSER